MSKDYISLLEEAYDQECAENERLRDELRRNELLFKEADKHCGTLHNIVDEQDGLLVAWGAMMDIYERLALDVLISSRGQLTMYDLLTEEEKEVYDYIYKEDESWRGCNCANPRPYCCSHPDNDSVETLEKVDPYDLPAGAGGLGPEVMQWEQALGTFPITTTVGEGTVTITSFDAFSKSSTGSKPVSEGKGCGEGGCCGE